jgi:hypothetical protein
MFVNRNQAGMCTEPKLTSNWLPRWNSQLAAVASLRVRNPRNRSSSETFFLGKFVREPRPHCIKKSGRVILRRIEITTWWWTHVWCVLLWLARGDWVCTDLLVYVAKCIYGVGFMCFLFVCLSVSPVVATTGLTDRQKNTLTQPLICTRRRKQAVLTDEQKTHELNPLHAIGDVTKQVGAYPVSTLQSRQQHATQVSPSSYSYFNTPQHYTTRRFLIY